jgi:hypothetical protein
MRPQRILYNIGLMLPWTIVFWIWYHPELPYTTIFIAPWLWLVSDTTQMNKITSEMFLLSHCLRNPYCLVSNSSKITTIFWSKRIWQSWIGEMEHLFFLTIFWINKWNIYLYLYFYSINEMHKIVYGNSNKIDGLKNEWGNKINTCTLCSFSLCFLHW